MCGGVFELFLKIPWPHSLNLSLLVSLLTCRPPALISLARRRDGGGALAFDGPLHPAAADLGPRPRLPRRPGGQDRDAPARHQARARGRRPRARRLRRREPKGAGPRHQPGLGRGGGGGMRGRRRAGGALGLLARPGPQLKPPRRAVRAKGGVGVATLSIHPKEGPGYQLNHVSIIDFSMA